MQIGLAGGVGQQLRVARAVHGDEEPGRRIEAAAHGEQPVVAEDGGLVGAEGLGDALALADVEHDARVVVEQGVVLVEGARVLRQGIEEPPEVENALPWTRVAVGGGDDVGAGLVDGGVDGERGPVDGPVALDDLALVVDEDAGR